MEVTAIGDRAGLGIATVLTEIFLLEFSSQGMPKVSYMKLAELYVVVSFGFIFLALLESALVYKASSIILKRNKEDKGNHEDIDEVPLYNLNINILFKDLKCLRFWLAFNEAIFTRSF